jgi:hypothetical protein
VGGWKRKDRGLLLLPPYQLVACPIPFLFYPFRYLSSERCKNE